MITTTLEVILFLLVFSGSIYTYLLFKKRITTARLLKQVEGENQKLSGELSQIYSKNDDLTEESKYYKELVETANDFIFRCDINGYFLYSNNKAIQSWGVNYQDLIHKRYLDFIREDYRRKIEKFFFKQFVSKELTTYCEYPIYTTGNQEIWLGQNTHLLIGNGKPIGFQAVARDITILRNTQEQLSKSEEQYRNVVNILQEGIIILDDTCAIITANKSAEKILGLTSDQMIGVTSFNTIWRTIYEDGSNFADEDHPAMVSLRTGLPQTNIIMGVHRSDDELVWISIDSQPIFKENNQKPNGVVVSFSDITLRKKAEDELLRTNANVEAWMNNTNDAIWSVDREYTLIACNNHFRELFELFFDTKISKNDNFNEKMPEESRDNFKALYDKALSGETFSIEYPIFNDGEITFFEVTFNPIYESTKITGVAVHGKNITQRKYEQDEILRAKANLEAWMNNTNDGVWAIDRDYNIILMNNISAERSHSLTGNAVQIGDSALQLFPKELSERWIHIYNRALAGERFIEEQSHISFDNNYLHYELSFNPIYKGGDITGVAVLEIDVTERKQIEQKHGITMRLQQAILHSSNYLIIATELDGTITTFNPAAEKALGYKAEELIGKFTPGVFHDVNEIIERAEMLTIELGFDVPVGFETFVAKAKLGQLYEEEWSYIRKDDSRFPVLLSISALRSESGEITGFLGISSDITAKKQTLAELEKRDILLEGTSNALQHLITSNNFEEGVEDTLSIVGQASNSDRVYLCKTFLSKDDIPSLQLIVEWHKQLIEFQENRYNEISFDKLNLGRWYKVLSGGSVIQGTRSEFPKNERKVLIESGIYSVLLVPIILNGSLWGFLGVYDFHTERIWAEWERSAFQSVAASLAGAIERNEAQVSLKNQAQDLELKNIELTAARESAEIANLAKSTFLSNMSHELRTPLNAILGFAQILQKDKTLPEQNRNYITMMYRSGNHLLDMINDVLDISKIEAGKMDLLFEDFDFHELLHDIEQMFTLRCKEKNLGFHIQSTAESLRFVIGDHKRIKQVLINLIGNAVKFTTAGKITVAVVERNQMPNVAEKTNEQLTWVKFSIADTGRGIPHDQIHSLFQPFKQVTGVYSEGTGLGLTICDRIIRMMGGEITIESEIGVGSTFTFEIPLQVRESTFSIKTTEAVPIIGIKGEKQWRILIVDDIPSNCIVAQGLLEPIGFVCVEADSGITAIEKVKEFQPDLILMDILMPDMRGDDATKILREMPEYEKLPIIALTASGFDGKRDELMELGFSEYLRKPFLENELYTMISTFIPVEYIYEEQHNETTFSSDNSSADEIAKYVRELPDNLQAELSEAIEFQEFEKIERIIKLLPDNSSNHKLRSSLERAVLFSNYKILTAITDCLQSNS